MPRRILWITFDGLLQPLGHSQIVRVATALARAGHGYDLASLERSSDLARRDRVEELRAHLADHGIRWHHARFEEGGGGRAIAVNCARLLAIASEAIGRHRHALVHARAIHGGLIARALRARHGTPYLFDARSYWVDEQVEEGRRFRGRAAYLTAKRVERAIFERAAGIVTLTELQADDVRTGALGRAGERPIMCIPTCADYHEFHPCAPGAPRPPELAEVPDAARIFGIVGALNRSYYAEETIDVARRVLARDPRFRLVVLSAQIEEYRSLLAARGIDRSRAHVLTVPHGAMPAVVPHLEWGALLLRTNFAKRASVPTKLAEFFAAGVRPLHHGCNEEVAGWVARAGSGLVLDDVAEASRERAASAIVREPASRAVLEAARARTEPHFSLESGVTRYDRIVRSVLDAS